MKKIVLAALLLIGCGPKLDTTASTHCYVDGLDVTLEYRTNCDAIVSNIAQARRTILQQGILPEDQWNLIFEGLKLTVAASTDLGCVDKTLGFCTTWQWGRYQYYNDGYAEIRLACHMKPTLHEFFHRIEHKTGVWAARQVGDGDKHTWWNDNSFNMLDDAYQDDAEDGCYSVESSSKW